MARSLAYHNTAPAEMLPDYAPKDAVKRDFAKRLQQALNEKGWNQSELSVQATKQMPAGKSIGRYSVSCYVTGKSIPRPTHLTAICKALGVKPNDLLPTRGVPNADAHNPALDLKDMGEGKAWLRINMAVDWATALEVMKLLKSKGK